MEKCATLLRSVAMLPERAKLLVEVTLHQLDMAGGRPTDDKVSLDRTSRQTTNVHSDIFLVDYMPGLDVVLVRNLQD